MTADKLEVAQSDREAAAMVFDSTFTPVTAARLVELIQRHQHITAIREPSHAE